MSTNTNFTQLYVQSSLRLQQPYYETNWYESIHIILVQQHTLNLNHVIEISIVLKFIHVSCQHFMAECILDLFERERYSSTMILLPMSVRKAEMFTFLACAWP